MSDYYVMRGTENDDVPVIVSGDSAHIEDTFGDDVAPATDEQVTRYENYWNGPCPCGAAHERGDHPDYKN